MKLEFTSKEVEDMVREAITREFPDHDIEHYNQTTYGHLIVDLKRRSLFEDRPQKPDPVDTSARFESEYGG